jgi:hypothetical protein
MANLAMLTEFSHVYVVNQELSTFSSSHGYEYEHTSRVEED